MGAGCEEVARVFDSLKSTIAGERERRGHECEHLHRKGVCWLLLSGLAGDAE